MSMTEVEIQNLTEQALEQLQTGNASNARNLFAQIVAVEPSTPAHWFGLAYACSNAGDQEATLNAIDKILELEPQNLRANLFKADHLTQNGRPNKALEYYQYALKLASKEDPQSLPDDIKQGLQRGITATAALEKQYQSFLLERMAKDGFISGSTHPRFQQSLDIMFGTKKLHLQEPRRFYYPGLPQIQYYEREQFDWIEEFESYTSNIRAELDAVMQDSSGPSRFSPYLKTEDSHLGQENAGLADNDSWSALFLWEFGKLVTENADLFPSTINALKLAPLPDIKSQAPVALFSKLAGGTRIPAHFGLLNTRLICHLPIIVPENCGGLRVGNETRAWEEGKMLIFDDSMEHEAWNTTEAERVVLLFEIWRPEISEQERLLITSMLAAVKEFQKD